MKIYSRFARFAKAVYRLFHIGYTVEGNTASVSPTVYVIHHQNLSGPIHAVGLLKDEARIWVYHMFLTRKACFDQFYSYTFTQRFRWPKPFAFLAAGALSLILPPLLRAFGAVPVYRGTGAFSTFRQSLLALTRGENLIICPDIEYSSSSSKVGDVYTGYLGLEKFYYKETGRHLRFVPLYVSRSSKALVMGNPITFINGREFKRESLRVSAALRASLNMMGTACGDIAPAAARYEPGDETAFVLKT